MHVVQSESGRLFPDLQVGDLYPYYYPPPWAATPMPTTGSKHATDD